MKDKLEQILIAINEAIETDGSESAHLYVARSAIEKAIEAVERSVAHIMESKEVDLRH